MNRSWTAVIIAGVALGACAADSDATPSTADGSTPTTPTTSTTSTTSATTATTRTVAADADQRYPDVVGVEQTYDDRSGTWTFAVTISSPYDTPERYADGWRVVGPDGTVYGIHTLTHDHANEQPFTRRQAGVVIPDGVEEVTIQGRDQFNGFGGDTVTISLQTGAL